VDGSDNNYVEITDVGSQFRLKQGQPLSIGGRTGQNNGNHFITDADNSGNYLKIANGATADLNSLYIMGNSTLSGAKTGGKFVLGQGGASVSQATVAASTGNAMYAAGVTLFNASTRMEMNNGRLVAGVNGKMVSGLGQIDIKGPAFFSTTFAGSSIDSSIVDSTGSGGTLTKEGTGTLTLTATNTYLGSTVVSAGVLQVGNGGTAGSLGAGSVTNNTSLVFNRSDALSVSSVISGGGTLAQIGGGTLTLGGTNTYTGATTLTAGTLSVGADANLGGTNTLIFDGGALQVTGSTLNNFGSHAATFNTGKTAGLDIGSATNTFTISQALNQGAGGLTKLGAGKLLITGNNTYTGATTVSGGVLQIGDGGSGASISASSGIVLSNNSDVIFDNADAANFGQNISGAAT
jgi:autotransporter-associated beta strand protein